MSDILSAPVLPVIFSSDEYFVPYMSALIQSIMDNAKTPCRYRFYVLHRSITPESRRLLKMQALSGGGTGNGSSGAAESGGTERGGRFSIDFVDVASRFSGYRLDSGRLDLETWFRLLVPWLFDYEKTLYLDSDMICNADLAELFTVDLKDNLVAACRDDFLAGDRGRRHARSIGFESHRDYFNAGMLLFNMGAFQRAASMKTLLDLAASRSWDFNDQDVLNVFCKGRALVLNMEWNAMVTMYNEDAWPPELRAEYRRSRQHPKIAHFAGPKPWDTRFGGFGGADRRTHLELFLRYAERTPFIALVRERMEHRNGGYSSRDRWF